MMSYNFETPGASASHEQAFADNDVAFLSNDDDAAFLRDDDDDDARVMAYQLSAAACLLLADEIDETEETKRKRCWVKPYRKARQTVGNTQSLMQELTPYKADVKNFIRMDEEDFNFILALIRPDIEKQDTVMRNAIPAKEKLAVTLRFLATGESFMELDYNSKLSKSFLSTAILEVCEAIVKHLKDQFLKFPTTKQEWLKIANEFEEKWQFPHCLGTLDGKHIIFKPSKKEAPLFYNYKGSHSIVLLGLADAHGKFICIDVGCNGRISDGGVLQRSKFMYILQQPEKYLPPKAIIGDSRLLPYVFVADNAFPLSQNMLTPYPFTTIEENKKTYNRRLSRARQSIERAFGMMSNKFQIFQKPINLHQDKVKLIVKCCCTLHNFLITRSRWYREENINENQYSMSTQLGDGRLNPKNYRTGEIVRKAFSEYFNNEGAM